MPYSICCCCCCFMFCLVSSLHIMIIFYYIAPIEMSSMQLLQKQKPLSVMMLRCMTGRAFINIERWPFVYPASPARVPNASRFCDATKSTSDSIGNLHTESLGVKISSEQKVACENVNENLLWISRSSFRFELMTVQMEWKQTFCCFKIKMVMFTCGHWQNEKRTVDVATAELLQCHHSFMHFIA